MEQERDLSFLESMEPMWGMRRDDGRTSLAVAGGVVAAVAGGGVWAAIVLVSGYETGWAAWGVGVLVGGAMARITSNRGRRLGLTAAGLAAAGLIVGELVITVGSAGAVSEELADDPEALQAAVARQMYAEGTLDPATRDRVDAVVEAGDTLPDALWADMLRQAEKVVGGMTDEERRAAVRSLVDDHIEELGTTGAVAVQLGPWDIVWFALALVTAYGIMAERRVGSGRGSRPAGSGGSAPV
ncbi:MAG: hypothetical protein ACOC8B_00445 [Gemmatimonadota bacterium]